MGTVRLQHDEARINIGTCWRDQEIDRHLRARSRLQRHESPQTVIDVVNVVHFIEQGRPGNFRGAADDHLADLSLAVNVDQVDGAFPRFGQCHFRYQPHGC